MPGKECNYIPISTLYVHNVQSACVYMHIQMLCGHSRTTVITRATPTNGSNSSHCGNTIGRRPEAHASGLGFSLGSGGSHAKAQNLYLTLQLPIPPSGLEARASNTDSASYHSLLWHVCAHRLLSSSFLWFIYNILQR